MKLRDKSSGPFKAMTEARYPGRSYCIAHADVLFDDPEEPYIIEAKTVGAMAGKRREGQVFSGYDVDDLTAQGVPDAVFLQVQWQMMCYGVDLAYVAALIDNQFYTFGPIHAEKKVQESCLALAERFWRLVEADTAPAPETWDDVVSMYPLVEETSAMIAGDDEMRVREMISRDKQVAARIKELTDERDDIKNAIGVLIGGNAVLASASGDTLAKASEQSRTTCTILARETEIKKKLGKKKPDPITPEESRILSLADEIRALDLVSVSEFRMVRY
jgi:hypothetical protein